MDQESVDNTGLNKKNCAKLDSESKIRKRQTLTAEKFLKAVEVNVFYQCLRMMTKKDFLSGDAKRKIFKNFLINATGETVKAL